jgi:hypothetical protein
MNRILVRLNPKGKQRFPKYADMVIDALTTDAALSAFTYHLQEPVSLDYLEFEKDSEDENSN